MFSYFVLDTESKMMVPHLKRVILEGCPMPDTYLNGRPVYFGDVHFDGVDSYFESASYADNDEDLDDNELDQLGTECANYLVVSSIERRGYFKK